jgi:hypothetical protein
LIEVIGVYNANSTILGEVSYWIGARFGVAHCSLCDITHGLFAERKDWKSCRDQSEFNFSTFHRNDQPEAVRAVANDVTPVVVAFVNYKYQVLLGPQQIDACEGSPERLVAAITEALVAIDKP